MYHIKYTIIPYLNIFSVDSLFAVTLYLISSLISIIIQEDECLYIALEDSLTPSYLSLSVCLRCSLCKYFFVLLPRDGIKELEGRTFTNHIWGHLPVTNLIGFSIVYDEITYTTFVWSVYSALYINLTTFFYIICNKLGGISIFGIIIWCFDNR